MIGRWFVGASLRHRHRATVAPAAATPSWLRNDWAQHSHAITTTVADDRRMLRPYAHGWAMRRDGINGKAPNLV